MAHQDFLAPSNMNESKLSGLKVENNIPSRRTSVMSNASRMSMDSGDRYGSISLGNNMGNDIPIMQEELAPLPEINSNKDTKTYFQTMIPILPLYLSIPCLVLNIFLPGIGTCASGFFVICKGEPIHENHKERSRFGLLYANVTVGICQLATIVFMFVGWFWSIAWGIYLVENSVLLRKQEEIERQKELQKRALNALIGSGGKGGALNLKGLFKK